MLLHIIDRTTAKSIGLKYYFTGEPCKRGNFAERTVSHRKCRCQQCKDIKSNFHKEYRAKNKEALSEKAKIYHENNKDRNNERSKKWRNDNTQLQRQYEKRWREINKEKECARLKKFKENHPDLQKIYQHNNYTKHREKILSRKRAYYKTNPEKARAYLAKRRSLKLNATPLWYSEIDEFVLHEAFLLCVMREKETGFKWNLDHMIPLQAKNVCGMHVWNNFQVIPSNINKSKSNRLIYTNPHEWLHDIPKFFNVTSVK